MGRVGVVFGLGSFKGSFVGSWVGCGVLGRSVVVFEVVGCLWVWVGVVVCLWVVCVGWSVLGVLVFWWCWVYDVRKKRSTVESIFVTN